MYTSWRKWAGLGWLIGILGFLSDPARAADAPAPTVQAQLESLAATNSHFVLEVMLRTRPLSYYGSKPETYPLAAAQSQLLAELQALGGKREELAALLKHPDPKVRVLALGALFQREDGRDLPLIASLIEDPAPAFPVIAPSPPGMIPPLPNNELSRKSQSVGYIAQAMLKFYGVREPVKPPPAKVNDDLRLAAAMGKLIQFKAKTITTKDFESYWQPYVGRAYAASWFGVQMERANQGTTPIQTNARPAIERVIQRMDALPPIDRAWTRLYVLTPEYWNVLRGERNVPDADLVASTRQLKPDALLKFLQHQLILDDPDLCFTNQDNPHFNRMSDFILSHANELLRPEMAHALLSCEVVEKVNSACRPAWAIGAALLQPARAAEILKPRIEHRSPLPVSDPARLAGSLWQIRGASEKGYLVNWLYQSLPSASDVGHEPAGFLQFIHQTSRPDTDELMIALIQHPRFALADFAVLTAMLDIASQHHAGPLIENSEFGDAMPNVSNNSKVYLAKWRNLLRHAYGLSEVPPPPPVPAAQHRIAQPLYSLPLAEGPKQLAVSPDGRWLATITGNWSVNFWDATNGQAAGEIPRQEHACAWWVGFSSTGEVAQVVWIDFQGRTELRQYDIGRAQTISHVPLDGNNDGTEGAYDFAPCGRLAFRGNSLGCFDSQTGQFIWSQQGKGNSQGLAAISRDGKIMATTSCYGGRQLQLLNADNGQELHTLNEFTDGIRAMVLSPDGKRLATTTDEDGPTLWNTATGQKERQYFYPPQTAAANLAFSPDGARLAIIGHLKMREGCRVGVFRVGTNELLNEFLCAPPISSFQHNLVFSPDGGILYTANGELQAWRLR